MDTKNGYLSNLFIEEVHIKDGFNPRKFFDDKEYRELAESVVSNGIIQPIVVRPTHDEIGGYWVVAGERRYRAAKDAQLAHIPALVREMTDQEAKLIATLENTQRADMSPAEEAQAARDVLMGCENDRQEAVRLLGWGRSKFEARLLLLHADQSVLDALSERKIKLGHAELFSQLPKDMQVATLEKVLQNGYSVNELNSRLAAFALDLSVACFDTADCQNCPHNSAMQASLFDEHITGGKCANRECFDAKVDLAMSEKKALLSEKFATVFLDTERPPESYTITCKAGKSGVGGTQFEQGCRQCAHFGALLNTTPGSIGEITEDCCFNLECHKEKIELYQASMQQPVATTKKSSKNSGNIKSTPTPDPATSEKNNNSTDEKNGVSAAAIPNKVIEKVETFYRELAAKSVTQNRRSVLCINTFSLYRLVRGSFSDKLWPDSIRKKGSMTLDLDAFLDLLSGLENEEISTFNQKLLTHLLSEHEKSTPIMTKAWAKGAATAVGQIDVELADYFVLDKEFLGSFTKAGIEGVLREAINRNGMAFVTHYEAQGESQTFANLMKKKNGEILDDAFGCGYDFTGFVPACVSGFLGKPKGAKKLAAAAQLVQTIEPVLTPATTEKPKATKGEQKAEPLPPDAGTVTVQQHDVQTGTPVDDDEVLSQVLKSGDSTSDYLDFEDEQGGENASNSHNHDFTIDPEEDEKEESYV